MKIAIPSIVLTGIIFMSCTGRSNFITGSWTIVNLNSSDTSMNVETLFATSLVSHYAEQNTLTFSSGNMVTLANAGNKELDKGNYSLEDNDTYMTIKFPTDKMESRYKINSRTDTTIALSGTDNGETVNITMKRLGN